MVPLITNGSEFGNRFRNSTLSLLNLSKNEIAESSYEAVLDILALGKPRSKICLAGNPVSVPLHHGYEQPAFDPRHPERGMGWRIEL